jgi:hypothetical protein
MDPLARPVHFAALIRKDGAVSPVCAARPRKINLKVASWTNRQEAITCPRCLTRVDEFLATVPGTWQGETS